MSTEVMEAEAVDIQADSSTVQPVGDTAEAEEQAPEVAEPDPEEVARAESEGMVVVDPPKAEPPVTSGPEWQLNQIAEVNESVIEQQDIVDKLAKELKIEKGELESRQKQLNRLISEIADARKANDPDPERYPLYDKPKDGASHDDVNAMFPKPEAIQPGMPSTLEGLQAIRARDTKLADLKFGKRIMTKFEEHGVVTVRDFQEKPIDTLGLTEKQHDEVDEVMVGFWKQVKDVWEEANPPAPVDPPEAEAGATLGDVVKGEFPEPEAESD